MGNRFVDLGAYLDFFQRGKYMGSLFCEHDINRGYGYESMEVITLDKNITLDTGKTIKAGSEVKTYQMKLCGKRL